MLQHGKVGYFTTVLTVKMQLHIKTGEQCFTMDKMPRQGPVLWSGTNAKCANSNHVQFLCNEPDDDDNVF
jgi:hypothetical protein